MGSARLPVSLPGEARTGGGSAVLEARSKILLWLVVGPEVWLLGLPTLLFWTFFSENAWFLTRGKLYLVLFSIVQALFALGAVFWIVGREGRNAAREFLKFPSIQWVGLGLAFPICLAALLPTEFS
jgi:hypothetical protein